MTGIVPMWTDENGDTKWTTLVSTDVDDPGTSVYKPEIIGSAGGLGTIGVKAINLTTATTQTRAETYASGYVNRYCQYDLATVDFDSYTVKAVDLHYIDLGPTDKISLYSPVQILCNPGPYIIGKTLTCTSLEINIDAPETSSYTFEVFRPKASSNDKVLTRDIIKSIPYRTNTMHFNSGDNVSY